MVWIPGVGLSGPDILEAERNAANDTVISKGDGGDGFEHDWAVEFVLDRTEYEREPNFCRSQDFAAAQ